MWTALFLFACSRTPATGAPPPAAAVAGFWAWFAAHDEDYRVPLAVGEAQRAALAAELTKVGPGLSADEMLEGSGVTALVLHAERREQMAAVTALAHRAPGLLGWRVVAFAEANPGGSVDGLPLSAFYARASGSPAAAAVEVWLPEGAVGGDALAERALRLGVGESVRLLQVDSVVVHAAPAPEGPAGFAAVGAFLGG